MGGRAARFRGSLLIVAMWWWVFGGGVLEQWGAATAQAVWMYEQLPIPDEMYITIGDMKMAQTERMKENTKTAARDKAQARAENDGWKGFVNVELSPAQKQVAQSLFADEARLWDNILALVETGYKMTISYDATRYAYNVSVTCRAPKDLNNGYTLTGRGGSLLAALVSFWAKHEFVLDRNWASGTGTGSGRFQANDFD